MFDGVKRSHDEIWMQCDGEMHSLQFCTMNVAKRVEVSLTLPQILRQPPITAALTINTNAENKPAGLAAPADAYCSNLRAQIANV